MYENTIPGHYIVGTESYTIPFDFLKDTERNFNSETKIFKSFNFLFKNRAKGARPRFAGLRPAPAKF